MWAVSSGAAGAGRLGARRHRLALDCEAYPARQRVDDGAAAVAVVAVGGDGYPAATMYERQVSLLRIRPRRAPSAADLLSRLEGEPSTCTGRGPAT